MHYIKKISLLFCIFFSPLIAFDIDEKKIIRISQESLQQSVLVAKSDEQYRSLQRWAITGVTVAAVITLFNAQSYFAQGNNIAILQPGEKCFISSNSPIEVVKLGGDIAGWAQYLYREISSNATYLAINSGAAASSFIAMLILNNSSQQLGTSWKYFHEVETLSGFINHTTKLHKLFFMTKEFAVPFDIYSTRLSMDLNFGQQRILLADFMKDIIEAIDTSNEWHQGKLLAAMKKDYLYKTSSLQELQEFALHAINYRQRIELGLVDNPLEIEVMNRMAIAEFCNFLILEIEKIAAFVQIKVENSYMKSYFTDKVQNLIKATNLFAEQVEMKLALPMDDLYEQSKRGDGLFDLICNFNILVNQHVEMMSYRL